MPTRTITVPKRIGLIVMLALVLGLALPATVAADKNESEKAEGNFNERMEEVGQFLVIVIGAVAIPNGAFGLFQWMTAGTDTEQSDKGRKRIRNSFIGLAGAAVIMIAVDLLKYMVGL